MSYIDTIVIFLMCLKQIHYRTSAYVRHFYQARFVRLRKTQRSRVMITPADKQALSQR